jgi:hypothetical protein
MLLFVHQHAYLLTVRHDRIETNRRRILVIMDFSKFNLLQNITATSEEKKDKAETVHDMIQVFEYWEDAPAAETESEIKDTESKEEKRSPVVEPSLKKKRTAKATEQRREVHYVDNLVRDAGAEGNDTAYVRVAMRNAIEKGWFDGFTQVDLFSDGGPKHYKSVYGMKMMSEWADWWAELKPGKPVPELIWNFTAPYHGHGMADSHAGIFSQKLTRTQNAGQQGGGSESIGGGPQNVDEVAALMCQMKNTVPYVFDKIDRDTHRTDMYPLTHIREHFQFRFRRLPSWR